MLTLVSACKEATNVELLLQSGVAVAERPVGVNLRHERFVPTGPLNPNLPSLQTRPQASAVRHKRPFPRLTLANSRFGNPRAGPVGTVRSF
jgi:hypothetical protein